VKNIEAVIYWMEIVKKRVQSIDVGGSMLCEVRERTCQCVSCSLVCGSLTTAPKQQHPHSQNPSNEIRKREKILKT
jgi:hypothetical protein